MKEKEEYVMLCDLAWSEAEFEQNNSSRFCVHFDLPIDLKQMISIQISLTLKQTWLLKSNWAFNNRLFHMSVF